MIGNKLNRRNLLKASSGFALGVTLLPYKSMAAEEKKMNLYSWDSYLGENTLADFNKATGVEVKLDLFGSNDELFAKLKAGNPGYDEAEKATHTDRHHHVMIAITTQQQGLQGESERHAGLR